ncbi:Rmd-3 [Aphelenchoides besseyi]|nr:Rmd-3 [Aphelenchoides besseyi]KAI6210224.1 Rmd-3 [Aphelenchoides besseyi]
MSSELEKLLRDVDNLIDDYNGEEAHSLLLQNFGWTAEDPKVVERFAKCFYILANCEYDQQKRAELLAKGRDFAVRGLATEPENFELLKYAAALTGVLAEQSEETRDRINLGHEFKNYLDKALTIEPNDHMLLHMRGRFHYHIAGIGILERGVAALFFRTIPSATYEDALRDFLAMEEQTQETESAVDNLLYIGKCYKQMGQKEKAIEYLSKLSSILLLFMESHLISDRKRNSNRLNGRRTHV